ncbi:hypothetical protein KP509_08G018600 [Ceratopteris richardii]|uniref:Uncharacterized protein n=1 Tax=Ceratopteris richardii TaxID=49495 RepID=A0A8T2U401_CERRI|nr:hypothetical protein KP509_08G018600 [Ceratopteris richardii]
MADDEQHLKKAAALAYDYDNDPRWAEYMSNVLVPDNRPKSEVERYLKFKFYQRNIDPDLKVERLPSKSSSASTSTSNSSYQTSSNSGERSRGEQDRSYSAQHHGAGTNFMRIDPQSIGFLSNSLVVIMGAFAILPMMPPTISHKSYIFVFLGELIACGHSIYSRFGRPRALNLQAIQAWLQSSIAAKEFLYLLYSTVFITTLAPIKFAVIPVICQSLLNVTQFLKRDFRNTYIYRKYLDNLCKWVDANQSTVSMLSANCEIGVGFLLVFLLLSPRKNFVQVLAYWQLLKLMYHAPATAYFHRSIWSHIGTRLNPLIYRYVPFLQTPLQFAQRWFQG